MRIKDHFQNLLHFFNQIHNLNDFQYHPHHNQNQNHELQNYQDFLRLYLQYYHFN